MSNYFSYLKRINDFWMTTFKNQLLVCQIFSRLFIFFLYPNITFFTPPNRLTSEAQPWSCPSLAESF